MNKLRYRIVFNKARGMCMAVAETARSQGKGAARGAGGPADDMAPAALRLPALRRLAVLLGVGLGSLSLSSVVFAQVVADRTAPGQQRPTVLTTANGVIQVNVQTPSAAGVSHNTYSQFDVPQGGVILNNSRTNTQSQLGGWVAANPWMTQGTAKVILNEVNSSNPSRLQGYVEVAGDRAETVIANPAGIVVSGGGFINVSRATLTTGAPRLEDGKLTGYAVQRGQIVIDGAGLDASKTDYTALIARAIQVNAGIWARRLDVVTGVNDVILGADSPAVQARQASDAAPVYAIDVAKLGGMYANQIYLVGTEAGVGVRNAGNIGAAAGDLVVTASGRLENSGTLSASQSLKVLAATVDNGGTIQATGTLALQADSLRNAGRIQSAAQTLLTVQGDIDNSGGAIEAPRIELTSASLHNTGGTITQTGASALHIDADRVVNAGGTLGRQAAQGGGNAGAGTAVAQPSGTASTDTGAGTVPVDGAASVSGGTGTAASQPALADGVLETGLVDNTGGIIAANGDMMLRAGAFDNRGGHATLNTLSVAGTAFDNSGGTLDILRGLTVRSDSFVNDQGKLLVGAGFDASVGQFSNRQGLLQAGQFTTEVTGALDNSGGTISAAGPLVVSAGALANAGGTLFAGTDAAITAAGGVDNTGGIIQATDDLKLTATGAIGNHGGAIETLSSHSHLNVSGSAIASDGRIVNAGDGSTTISAATVSNGGQLGGNGDLTIGAATLSNGAGARISAVGAMDLRVTGALSNAGDIGAGNSLRMAQPGVRLDNHGSMSAQGPIEIDAAAVDNGQGTIATAAGSNSAIVLNAADLSNRGGTIQADAGASIGLRGALDNAAGHIAAGGDLTLATDGRIDNSKGAIDTAGRLGLHGGEIGNASGTISAAGIAASSIEADGAIDNGGQIGANGALTLKASILSNGAGTLSAVGNLDLALRELLSNQGGAISSGGTLRADQSGASLVNAGAITVAGETRLNFDRIDNSGGSIGTLQGAGLTLTANTLANRGGQIAAGAKLSLSVKGEADNAGGVLQAAGALDAHSGGTFGNQGGMIEALGAHGTLALDAAALDNTGGRIVNAGDGNTSVNVLGHIDTAGQIAGNGRLDLTAATMHNAGTVRAMDRIELAVGKALDNAGMISAGAGLHVDQVDASLRNSGTIVAGDTLALTLASFDNSGKLATVQGSSADVLLRAQSIGNRGGTIQADRDVQLSSGADVDNAGGTLHAGGSLRLDAAGRVGNNGGAIEALDANATLALHAGTVDNGTGRIVNVGTGATNITTDGTVSSAGTVAGNGALTLRVVDLDNQLGGKITAGAAFALTAEGGVANAGSIGSHDALALDAAKSVRNSGQIVGASVTVDAAAFDNGGGQLASAQGGGGAIALHAGSLANVGGTIVADGSASVAADGAFDNRGGTLHANGTLAVNAGGAIANGGGVIEVLGAGATLHVQAASIDNSSGHLSNVGNGATHISATGDIFNSGTLAGNGTVDVSAATLRNAAGATLSAGAALDLHASQAFENAGMASAAGSLTLDQAGAHIANSGDIAAGGAIVLRGASIDNDGGHIATQAGADLMLDSASTLSNRGSGNIAAAGNATLLAAGGYDNSNGQVQAQGRLQVSAGGALVNNGGALEAVGTASTLDLRAASIDNIAGRIVNAGNGISSVGSASSIVNSGTLAGNGALDISSLSLENQTGGTIGAVGALDLAVRQQLNNAGGSISSGGTLHFDHAAASFTNSGRIGAGAAVDIHAASIANDGGQLYTVNGSGAAIALQAGAMSNVGGTVAADGLLQDSVSGMLANDNGTLHGGQGASFQVGGALANGSGTIETAAGTLDVSAQSIASSGRIVNAGGGTTTLTSQNSIINSGSIAGNGALDVHTATLQNQGGGQVASGVAMLLDVHQQLGNAGTITSGGALRFEQAGASFSNSGQINAAGEAVFSAASFNNDGGHIATVAGSGAAIRVTAPALSNHGGTIVADGDAALSFAASADNTQGTLHAGHNLALTSSGAVGNAGGVIEAVGNASALSVDGASIDNGNGRIANMGHGDTRLTGQTGIVNSGTIEAAGNLVFAGQTLQNNAGATIASGGDMTLAVTQQLSNQGKVDSGGALTFNQAGATFANSGQVLAGGNVAINARVVNNDGGQLGTGGDSGADLVLSSDQLSNQGGRIATGRDLAMTTRSLTALGELFGGRDLSLNMDGDFVQGSGGQMLHANRDLSLSVTGSITNTATFGAGGTLTLSGSQINNQASATIEGKAVVLNASGNLANAGEINATSTLNISASNVGNSGGIVGGNVSVATGNLDNSGAAALVGATGSLALGVDGTLNNTGGATLYSSGDMAIGARSGSATGTVNNLSSTIEAGGSLALNATTLNNIRENVQIVHVKTVDENVQMTLPSWYYHGDNHNSYETGAANFHPHEVYFVKPSDILEDQEYVTPDGYTIHRAVIQTHSNDSAFFVAATGLYGAYGAQQRLTLSEGTRVIYYTSGGAAANPDQGGANSISAMEPQVTNWISTVSFSNQYGNCGSDCLRLVTQPGYDDPSNTIIRDTVRALAKLKEKLEVSRAAHHTAVEDQLAPGAGAVAQILAGGNMNLTVGSALNNQYADIKAKGVLNISGSTPNNVGGTLYRIHNFDGTWRTEDGEVIAYQQPSISEKIGSVAGVIHGEQGVIITGRSFRNIDVTVGTVGNIRDAVNVIGSGVGGAAGAGAHATANASGGGAENTAASASTSGNHAGMAGMANAISGGSGPLGNLFASAGSAANSLATLGMTDAGAASGPGHLARTVAATANQTHMDGVLSTSGAAAGQQAAAVQGTALGSAVKVAPSGLFLRNPDPNGSYIFETRPQFANQQQWTSSDYLLNQLAHDPALTQKRLGDGFYEQRMVREQLAELTGHASVAGASDDSEYKQLLTNAVSAAKTFDLRPGVALSPEQVSRLTSDIVWMVSEAVMLPDGSTDTVLVPQVYLAHVGPNAVKPTGALVTGDGVSINVSDSIVNQGGVIDGGKGRTLLLAGQDIVNQGGTIKGSAVAMAAGNDIKNESLTVKQSYDFGENSGSNTALSNVASITASGTLDMMAGRDLNDLAGKISAGSASVSAGRDISFNTLQTGSTYQSQIGGYTENDSTVTHQLSQISTGGDLKIAAAGNLNLTGTQVAIGTDGRGTGKLLAGGAINIAAVTDEVKTSVMNDPSSKQYDKQVHADQTVVGAGVNATGSLVLGAGLSGSGSINISGSGVSAGGALAMRAADSVNISSLQESHLSDTASTRTSSSVFKSKTTQQADYVASSDAVASSVSGKTVGISAGKDINVLGSAIVGEDDVSLAAAGSVNIGAATSTLTEQHHTQTKESGFLSGGGFGISYGTRTTTTDQQRDATTQSGQSRSLVGSLGGNLDIVAGNAIKVSGSDLAAGLDMYLAGRSVTIDPGQDNSKGKFEQKTVQDALTLAVGGSVVNALQTAQGMSSAASQSKDTRVQAMAAATAAMAAKDAASDYAKNGLSVSLSLTVGHSESDQKTTTSETLHTGSTLTAGRDLTIVAKGDGSGGNGDINVLASDIKAGRDIKLAATNQVNLLASQDLQSQYSESKSSSAAAGVGISYSTNNGMAFGLTASVSASKGNQDGDGTTQVNTHVNAGRTLAIASGGDTNIKGAVASANQVVADVGGNLNIASLQDTAKFDSKEQSASISGTYGYGFSVSGSLNQSKINSDYASVQEQSGIKAGDGGFQITVAGNTDLKGAVISSTKAGTVANSLTTKTLTQSEIENHATMHASSVGLSGSATVAGTGERPKTGAGEVDWKNVGQTGQSAGISGLAASSANDTSTTRSGISSGNVTITDDAAQRSLTGKGSAETIAAIGRNVATGVDSSGKIANHFDLNEVQTTLNVSASFSAGAAKLVGDYAESKLNQAEKLEAAAAKLSEGREKDELLLEAVALKENWKEDGAARVALHTVVGAAAGGVNGAVGAGATAFVTPTIADQISKLDGRQGLKDALTLAAGAVIGDLTGGTAGAAASVNEVQNNWLSHTRRGIKVSEQEQLAIFTKACLDGSSDACQTREKLLALSNQRDQIVNNACSTRPSAECSSAVREAMREGNKVVLSKDGVANIYAVGSPEAGLAPKIGDGSFEQVVSKSTFEGLQLDVGGIAGGALVTGAGKLGALFGFGAEAADIGKGAANIAESTTNAAKTSINPVNLVATPSNGGALYGSSQRTIINAELGPTYTSGDILSLIGRQETGASTAAAKAPSSIPTPISDVPAIGGQELSLASAKLTAVDASKALVDAEKKSLAKFSEQYGNRTYRSLDITINERGLVEEERQLAESAGWKKPDGSTWYPPYEGGMPGTLQFVTLQPGTAANPTLIDRFGRTAGSYVSPAGASFESRALANPPTSPAHVYSVEKPIADVEKATITPWFGEKGLGVQFKLPTSVKDQLIDKALMEK